MLGLILISLLWLGLASAFVIAGLGVFVNWDGWNDRLMDWHNSFYQGLPFFQRGESYGQLLGVFAVFVGGMLFLGWFITVVR